MLTCLSCGSPGTVRPGERLHSSPRPALVLGLCPAEPCTHSLLPCPSFSTWTQTPPSRLISSQRLGQGKCLRETVSLLCVLGLVSLQPDQTPPAELLKAAPLNAAASLSPSLAIIPGEILNSGTPVMSLCSAPCCFPVQSYLISFPSSASESLFYSVKT